MQNVFKKVASSLVVGATVAGVCSSINAENSVVFDSLVEKCAEVQMRLKSDLSTDNITVNANNDIIQVVGFVDSSKQLNKVSMVLDNYKPVAKIINNVKVSHSTENTVFEEDLKYHVASTLAKYNLPEKDIEVHVSNGHVILGGFIDKDIPVNSIGVAAHSVPGVVAVDNYVLYKA